MAESNQYSLGDYIKSPVTDAAFKFRQSMVTPMGFGLMSESKRQRAVLPPAHFMKLALHVPVPESIANTAMPSMPPPEQKRRRR
ncbi:hypothetical protein N5K37_21155 [Delftia tsuruhatensis]|uniref:hypothetical protein n=1 Tax=Comamonadaceae TaxID=80864 RepID=UPI000F847AA1|nr:MULTISPECIES: hypothetical protein [Comamonadaceae]MDH2232417.1 hypothetical protein [Delftia tsuruhatensis]